jgi:hypothetical protein
MKLLIKQFSPTPVTSSLFGPNILLSTLFSNTLSLYSSFNVRDQVSHPYTTICYLVFREIIKNIYNSFAYHRVEELGKRCNKHYFEKMLRIYKLLRMQY